MYSPLKFRFRADIFIYEGVNISIIYDVSIQVSLEVDEIEIDESLSENSSSLMFSL